MKARDIKTIDVHAKEWFDKTNGNSYFSAVATINHAMKNEKTIYLGFQYGYGDHYKDMAYKAIRNRLNTFKNTDKRDPFHRVYDRYGIVARYVKEDNCLKREVKDHGTCPKLV